MTSSPFTSGRKNDAGQADASGAPHTHLLPPGWERAALVAFPQTSTDAFVAALVSSAPDDAMLLANRDVLGLLAERATLNGRPALATRANVPSSLLTALETLRPPVCNGPIFIQAELFTEDMEMHARRLRQTTTTLGGYAIDAVILGDAVGRQVSATLIGELNRRTTAVVVQSGARVLPIDLKVATGLLASPEVTDDLRDAWAEMVYANETGELPPPTEEAVRAHADFLVEAGDALLEDMHRPIMNAGCRDIFGIWRQNFETLLNQDPAFLTASDAIARLDRLTPAASDAAIVPADRLHLVS